MHTVLESAPPGVPVVVELRLDSRESFAGVFHEFYTPLMRYARRLTGDGATAEDVVQDVFLKLWERRGVQTIESSLNALLYTMVRNRSLNIIRKRSREVHDVDLEAAPEMSSKGPSSEELLASEMTQRRIQRWIDELPPRRAEAFRLSRDHGLKHREIAAIMNVSERTVNTHILLALRVLRQRLDNLETNPNKP